MPSTLGTPAEALFLNDPEAHKLHLEFIANAIIKAGQAVIMNANEKVDPAGVAPDAQTIIGYAIKDAAAGELITIAMRPFAVIYARSGAAVNAGPVQIAAYAGGYNVFIQSTAVGKTVGFSLDTTIGASEKIRVALF